MNGYRKIAVAIGTFLFASIFSIAYFVLDINVWASAVLAALVLGVMYLEEST